MKYICFENGQTGKEEIHLFPANVHHDCFSEVAGHIKNHTGSGWMRINRYPVSAGFVDGNLRCHGKSETLGLESRPQDTKILKEQLSGN